MATAPVYPSNGYVATLSTTDPLAGLSKPVQSAPHVCPTADTGCCDKKSVADMTVTVTAEDMRPLIEELTERFEDCRVAADETETEFRRLTRCHDCQKFFYDDAPTLGTTFEVGTVNGEPQLARFCDYCALSIKVRSQKQNDDPFFGFWQTSTPANGTGHWPYTFVASGSSPASNSSYPVFHTSPVNHSHSSN